jgi:hypothetical protein
MVIDLTGCSTPTEVSKMVDDHFQNITVEISLPILQSLLGQIAVLTNGRAFLKVDDGELVEKIEALAPNEPEPAELPEPPPTKESMNFGTEVYAKPETRNPPPQESPRSLEAMDGARPSISSLRANWPLVLAPFRRIQPNEEPPISVQDAAKEMARRMLRAKFPSHEVVEWTGLRAAIVGSIGRHLRDKGDIE